MDLRCRFRWPEELPKINGRASRGVEVEMCLLSVASCDHIRSAAIISATDSG